MESGHSPAVFDVEIDDSAHENQIFKELQEKGFLMERRFNNDRLPLLGREDKKSFLIGLLHYKGYHVLS